LIKNPQLKLSQEL